MRIRAFVWTAAIAMLALLPALAADITGRWKAEFTSPDGQQRVNTFTFKVDGEKLTGTVAGSQDETKIENGTMKGDEISFSAERPFGRFNYKGKLNGEVINFKVDFEGNAFEITAKRLQ